MLAVDPEGATAQVNNLGYYLLKVSRFRGSGAVTAQAQTGACTVSAYINGQT
jgi:hypothetical protein